ncbi:hypothetical protein EDC26_1206 [Paralcaligenes ureilyticus]|uniref:Uncharacterized protein n=1 Tax=Paralcaligenes ureilyticus TaxID=627131 RepID=A0A4R3LNY8_9BURK|nr:hypothetical protein EDC26_1206 [Paralcaligenes ureilyticus]
MSTARLPVAAALVAAISALTDSVSTTNDFGTHKGCRYRTRYEQNMTAL